MRADALIVGGNTDETGTWMRVRTALKRLQARVRAEREGMH